MASRHNDNVQVPTQAFVKMKERCCEKMGLEECDCEVRTNYVNPVTKSLYKLQFPKVIVRASGGRGKNPLFVMISPEMVCASWLLRRRVERQIQKKYGWPNEDFDDPQKFVEELPYMKYLVCINDVLDGSEFDLFGKLPLMSYWVWLRLDDWCVQKIKEVRELATKVEKGKKIVNWDKPGPSVPAIKKDWNTVSAFEEQLFGDMDPGKFLALVQGKHDLSIDDLHHTTENWFRLYNGRDVKTDDTGFEVPVAPRYGFFKNFRVESYHCLATPGFYGAQSSPVPNNARGWTWWSRNKPGNSNYPFIKRPEEPEGEIKV